MNVLAISGSLRAASLNTRLLHAARELAPEGMAITVYRCTELPFYDGDRDDGRLNDETTERRLVTYLADFHARVGGLAPRQG